MVGPHGEEPNSEMSWNRPEASAGVSAVKEGKMMGNVCIRLRINRT